MLRLSVAPDDDPLVVSRPVMVVVRGVVIGVREGQVVIITGVHIT